MIIEVIGGMVHVGPGRRDTVRVQNGELFYNGQPADLWRRMYATDAWVRRQLELVRLLGTPASDPLRAKVEAYAGVLQKMADAFEAMRDIRPSLEVLATLENQFLPKVTTTHA